MKGAGVTPLIRARGGTARRGEGRRAAGAALPRPRIHRRRGVLAAVRDGCDGSVAGRHRPANDDQMK